MFRYDDVSYQLLERGKLVFLWGIIKVKTWIFEVTSNFSTQNDPMLGFLGRPIRSMDFFCPIIWNQRMEGIPV